MDTGSQGHLEIPGARSLLLATLPYSWHFHWGAHGEQAQNTAWMASATPWRWALAWGNRVGAPHGGQGSMVGAAGDLPEAHGPQEQAIPERGGGVRPP